MRALLTGRQMIKQVSGTSEKTNEGWNGIKWHLQAFAGFTECLFVK